MNKSEIIQRLAKRLRITKKDARILGDALIEEFTEILAAGDSVNIPGFGSFSVTELKKRRGFNPLIEKWMMLPPRRKAHFKPGEKLKKRVNLS